jgi:hypothetical protein
MKFAFCTALAAALILGAPLAAGATSSSYAMKPWSVPPILSHPSPALWGFS